MPGLLGFLFGQDRADTVEKLNEGLKGDIRMISGCEDHQESSDVSNVTKKFELPDSAGRSGGACTSALLHILYKDHKITEVDLSFTELLLAMQQDLKSKNYVQVPQLSASKEIDVTERFDLVPETATGDRRALLIGINYTGHEQGELTGCHNDVANMVEYIKTCHSFTDDHIQLLMDDGKNEIPTRENILAAYKKIVEESQPGDAIFCHFSGHCVQVKDDNGDEEDGMDEALVPVNYREAGIIRDDLLYEIFVKPMKEDVHCFFLMDACHSGTALDLPYIFKADSKMTRMEVDAHFNLGRLS